MTKSSGASASTDKHEETKKTLDDNLSGVGGLKKATEMTSSSAKEEPTIVGADKRMLSGMNMALASKNKYK